MFTDPDMMLARAHSYQQDAINEVDRYRVLAAARRARRDRRAGRHGDGPHRG
jgi:hypothetical protein